MMGAAPLNTNVGYYSRPGSAAGHHSAGGLLGMNLPGGSATSLHMPYMSPFAGPPSAHGSDFGTGAPQSAMGSFMSPMGGFAAPSVPSVYGMPAASLNPFGARPLSTFSLATTVNPFAATGSAGGVVAPSMNPSPTDDDLVAALRSYLSTQDLMSVTKKYVQHGDVKG
jgi:chitin synthase